MNNCEKCWRDHKETITTVDRIYKYCGFHAKELKLDLDATGEEYFS